MAYVVRFPLRSTSMNSMPASGRSLMISGGALPNWLPKWRRTPRVRTRILASPDPSKRSHDRWRTLESIHAWLEKHAPLHAEALLRAVEEQADRLVEETRQRQRGHD